ncbi:hypothetical protein CHS0354_027520 [Potamilus streckersoni]|uniref:Uncharacterized protein n=1 Tax=Potamilus streckersoni TaxID=2493646 RepID=A0AAE0VP94_9BIVA|nr:hypothetical protein CHS0354_027520 [Potamilus streckersoni]
MLISAKRWKTTPVGSEPQFIGDIKIECHLELNVLLNDYPSATETKKMMSKNMYLYKKAHWQAMGGGGVGRRLPEKASKQEPSPGYSCRYGSQIEVTTDKEETILPIQTSSGTGVASLTA